MTKHLVQTLRHNQTHIFSFMLFCCDSHIRQYHSIDVFRPTVISTGHKWKDWTSTCCPAQHSSTTISCDTPSCTVLAFCGECMEGRPFRIDILVAVAKSTDQCQTIHYATDFGTH